MWDLLKRLWAGWKRIARAIGRVQTMILLTIIYFLVIPFFSFMRLRDPLRKRLTGESYWQPFKSRPLTLEEFQRMF